ncbi:MAG TPA: MMPL family transporter [Polyangiaceae bacterium]
MSVERGEPSLRSRKFVRWTLRWGVWLWALALAAAVPATWRTAQLYIHLRSEMEQLLPRNAPSVIAIDELRARMAGLQHLGVVVDTGNAENLPAGERLLEDLAARVRAYPPGMVRAVRTGDGTERRFVEDHAPLYMDLADLETVRTRVEARRDWEASKQQGALLDEDEPPPSLDFGDLEKKYESRTIGSHHFDDDHFASREQHTALLLIEVGEFDTGRARGEALLGRVKKDLAALHPDSYAPGLRVGFTSDVAINTEETEALVADLMLSSVVVVVLVVAVIITYYEWWRSIVILLPPLLLATIYAFALASLWPLRVTELNSNTAFLGSIIVGNGINFGIVLLARYVEERRRGAVVEEALAFGVWGARIGTLSAALAAGVSYASLALTDFRGFRQFGFIGGLGMVLSWLLAFVLMPPLAAWVDRRPALPRPRIALMPYVVELVKGYPRLVVVVAAVLALGAAWQVRSFGPDQIETNFTKLRRADTWKTGEGYWGRKMDDLLGTYVTPTVILADDPDEARAIGRVLRKEEKVAPLDAMIANVRTLDDVVPTNQPAKIAVAEAIRDDLTPRIRASLTDAQRRNVDRLLGNGPLVPITASDLPDTFTMGLRERDGTVGRTVLVYPKPGHLLWEGPPLATFVSRLREAAATDVPPGGRPARLAGSLALSNDILESVRRDGVLASVGAFCGVMIVVLLLLRVSRATPMVLGSLLLGVLWLAGGMMALHIKINFANFIAYPITFGIGVDYSVNMASRWELEGRGSMAEVVRSTGGAVTLCSLTTITGYSSLLLAENRALFLFGLLAVLGEVACLSTAVLVLPACLEWWDRSRKSH